MYLPGDNSKQLQPNSINTDRIIIRDPVHGVGKIDKKTGDITFKNAVTGHITRQRKTK